MVVSVGRGADRPSSHRRPFDFRNPRSGSPSGSPTGGARPGDPTIAGVAGGRRAAVLGSPIAHSLSPALHRAAHAALGLTGWSYERIECREEELAPLVAGLGPAWVGLSLTMPLKRVALDVADDVSPLAAAVGAANTLLLDGARRAHNTDVAGIVGALTDAGVTRAETAAVLGAGGTAQAALAALLELGVTEPVVLVREAGRTGDLRAAAERVRLPPGGPRRLLRGPPPPPHGALSPPPPRAARPAPAPPPPRRPPP